MSTDDAFQKMVRELQQKVEYEEEATYSPVVIQQCRHPTHFGVVENPDAYGEVKGSCGDTMSISLRISWGNIQDARFWTDGCGATIACGNMLTSMIQGETIKDAARITHNQLLKVLGGLPEEHLHCSQLAIQTLQKTIHKYHKRKTD